MRRLALILAAALAVAVASVGVHASAGSAAQAPVTVSLTFDDSTASQALAGPMLASHGMHGTFYVISGRVGTNGYLTLPQLQSLAAGGNEIGDHTVTHLNLTTVDSDEATRQVCNARVQLMSWGFDVTDFAYPQGGATPALEQIVRNCNLNSARVVGNIVSPGTCSGCAWADTVPPSDPYAIATPDSIKSNWTLSDIEGLVTQAQQHGGGWVPMVFHKICAGCDSESVDPATLSAFLDWLQGQEGSGVTVKTVHDVIGGPTLPAVTGPVAQPPVGELLQDPSLEADADGNGVADCWTIGGSGVNTSSAALTNDAHSGNFAETVSISSFTSGDRRLQTAQDLGQCAPPVTPGDPYTVSAWVKGSGTLRWVAYTRNAAGQWSYWAQSTLTPSSSYTQQSWKTPPVPAGAEAISVGISLRSVGTFTADDFSLADSSIGDHTPPSVAITAPTESQNVVGIAPITATATDNVSVASVRFYLDGVSLGSRDVGTPAGSSSYRWNWNTAGVTPGAHVLTAVATDTTGNQAASAPIDVIVGSDVTAPVTTLQCNGKPTCASWYTAPVTVTLSATDDVAVAQTYYTTDGTDPSATNGTEYTGPFTVSQTTTVRYRSVDTSGNAEAVESTLIQVDTTAPTAVVTAPAAGADVPSGTVPINVTATDDTSVASVRFFVDGVSLGSKTAPATSGGSTYTWNWNTAGVAAGSHTLTAVATDQAGNQATSAPVSVWTGQGDTQSPTAAITSPTAGATVTGTTGILVTATDNVAVASVRFFVDGVSLGSKAAPTTAGGTTYKWNWDTTTAAKGSHTLTAVATDTNGNQTTSAPVVVTVG